MKEKYTFVDTNTLVRSFREIIRIEIGFLLACVLSVLSAQMKELPQDAVIAIVEGKPLLYKDIAYKEAALLAEFQRIYGMTPRDAEDYEKLNALRQKKETALLASHLENLIRQHVADQLGVAVSGDEVAQEKQKLINKVPDVDEALMERWRELLPLLTALRAVYERNLSEREAYDKYLVDRMPYKEWTIHRRYYDSPGTLQILEDFVNETPDELKHNIESGVRTLLFNTKLRERVIKELAATNREVNQYLGEVEAGAAEKGPLFLEQHIYNWWQNKYSTADVVIKYPQFSEAIHMLLNNSGGGV